MAISIGTKLGSHEVTALLGKGGMGEVYRARDSKLKREVAIKVLPEAFSRDPERVVRFQREAEVLASLNHANIASIYDVAEDGDTRYLVLELVEGETVDDRIRRGPIPVDEALQIAKRICEAVESAHDKGVVHRDLKPANIKLTPDGQVKVLDFGLAKVFAEPHAADLANSPTLVSASIPGAILGTAAYMSPEQAKGRDADRASDVWAFGCVLYEMLTGRPAFEGETVGEILGGVFKGEPAWEKLPAETPPAIQRLLRRCLQKDRARRLKGLDAARLEIEDALLAPAGAADGGKGAAPRASKSGVMRGIAYVIVSIALLAAGLLLGRLNQPGLAPSSPVRFTLVLPAGQASDPNSFGSVSGDGRYFVVPLNGNDGTHLWLQKLDNTSAKLLPGTTGASRPFWSPDNQSIGFFADGKLKRIDINGTPPRTLGDAPDNRGGTWSKDGTILFAASAGTGISKVSANGGEAILITALNKTNQDAAHRWPVFFPDGKHFTYNISAGQPESSGVFVGSLDDLGLRKRLLPIQSRAEYVESGHLLYVSEGALFARPFDLKSLSFSGDPILVEQAVVAFAGTGQGSFTASSAGSVIAVQSGTASASASPRQLAWYERSQNKLEPVGEPGLYLAMALSPDAKTVALEKRDLQTYTADIWLMDIVRGVSTRFTSHPLWDQNPVWSPDGNDIAFFSNREGSGSIYRKSLRGSGEEVRLYSSGERNWPSSWSTDGKYVLVEGRNQNQWDLLGAPVAGGEPIRYLTSRFNERQGTFAPGDQWVAYASDESGQYEIYIQSFPQPGSKIQVSLKGGTEPVWRPDGKELFFIQERKLTAVAVTMSGGRIEVSEPRRVADSVTFPEPVFQPNGYRHYGVASNGQRFLILLPPTERPSVPVTMILNGINTPAKN